MAEQLSADTDFNSLWSRRGRSPAYPWSDWFNGRIWKLTKGVDFKVDLKNFRDQCYARASTQGLKVHTTFKGSSDTIYIQAYKGVNQ